MTRFSLTGAILFGIASAGALWSSQVLAQDQAAPPAQAPTASERNPLQRLLDDGVLLRGTLNDDYQRNTTGGLQKGTENAGTALTHWLHARRDFAAPPFHVESFDLFSSELRPSGAAHTLLQRFPLR